MRKIEKKKISRPILAIILGSLVLVLGIAALVISLTLGKKTAESTKKEPPVALPGEAVYYNSLLASPTMDEKDIQYISVSNDKGAFSMVRPDKEGNFTLFYTDTLGNVHEYHPNIADLDDNFSYSDIYAIETGDGYNSVTKLMYLALALQLPYFEERIELNDAERDLQLATYGLSEGEYESVYFVYKDAEGNDKHHTLKIGDETVLGTGYYFMVDDRNYVYAGFSDYFEYALMGFYSFIKPIVIAPGIDTDTVIGAYLTTNYYQWLNTVHNTGGDITEEGSRVIAYTDVIVPVDKNFKSDDAETLIDASDGYFNGYTEKEFDLSKYAEDEAYRRMINALTGKAVGSYLGNEIVFTLTSNSMTLDFSASDSLLYEYTVTAVESVITDTAELSALGTAVGLNNLVKVSYTLKINGVPTRIPLLHAVVDLSNPALPSDFVNALRASLVGPTAPISLPVIYTKDNAVKKNVKYVITEIVEIYDKDGKEKETVSDSSIVTYRYRFMIDGVLSEDEHITTLNLGTDTSDSGAKLKELLKGKGVSNELSIVVEEYTEYCEYFLDFMTYSVSEIKYFVTKEIVSAFRFLNKSDRDPFYGESIYENTMENQYMVYGLNNSVCQKIVNILTGINASTSAAPSGLVGIETVAVGLTPEVMREFGLYANTIYFELPRGIVPIDSGDANEIDDYDWYEILGFTLYISEEKDGIRYVGSDLYDTVVKVAAENLVFLKYDFVNFFARRELMLTDITYIYEASFELHFEELKGAYDMYLNHQNIRVGSDGGRYTDKHTIPDGINVIANFDEINVSVYPVGDCTPNRLTQYMAERNNGSGFVSLTELYNKLTGNPNENKYAGYDPLGTSNFKKFIENIYYTTYSGVVSPEKQEEILATSPMLFRMSYKLSAPNASAYRYVYEFYRYSDSRVLVKLYQASYDKTTGTYSERSTPVADFYISNFAFQKIVNNFVAVLNLQQIDKEEGYID